MRKEGKLVLLVVMSVLIAGMHYSSALLPDGGASSSSVSSSTIIPGLEFDNICGCTDLNGNAVCVYPPNEENPNGYNSTSAGINKCQKTSIVCDSYRTTDNIPVSCYCTKDPAVAMCSESGYYSFDYGEPCASTCAGSGGIQCKCEYDPTASIPIPLLFYVDSNSVM